MGISKYLLLFLLLFGVMCSKDDSTAPDNQSDLNFENLTSLTINEEGGLIETDDFVLTIPPGTLDKGYEVVLLSATDPNNFGQNMLSKMFKVEGLPDTYKKPIGLSIKYEGSLSGESYIAMGEKVMPPSTGESITAFHLLNASDSSGWLSCHIPNPEDVKEENSKLKSSNETNISGFLAGCVSSYRLVYSSEGHFEVKYPIFVSDNEATALAEYLEYAYKTIQYTLGFSYKRRTKWPVEVVVKAFPFDNGAFGKYASSMLGNSFGWLEINSDKIGDAANMKVTAGHEFFHLVQALYENRNVYSKAKFESPYLWLHEATAVWSERLFSEDPDYQSTIVQPYQMAPFNGFIAGLDEGAQPHGYGMSVLFNFLTDTYGNPCIVETYKSLYKGLPPLEAIIKNTDEPVNWLENFFRQYVMNRLNVYMTGASFWNQNVHDLYKIDDINDIANTFSDSYADLSAKLYKIEISDNDIDEDDKITFTLEGEGVSEVTVLKYTRGQMQFIANSTSAVSIKNLKQDYLDKGSHLFALVTNNRAVPPYTGSSDIDLHIKVIREQNSPDFNLCGFSVKVLGQYHATTPDTAYDYESEGSIGSYEKYPGSFTENTFTGNYFREFATFNISGSITVVLNESHDVVTSISWTEEHNSANFTKTYSFQGENISYEWGDIYKAEGENSCDHITSFSVNQSAPDGLSYSLKSFDCKWDSKVYISFAKE